MKPALQVKRRIATWGPALAALAIAAPIACSSEPDAPSARGTAPGSPYSGYAIHVAAETKSGRKLLDFPPVEAVSAPKQTSITGSLAGSKPLVNVDVDGGKVDLEALEELDEPGWLLLMRAAAQCNARAVGMPWDSGGARPDHWYVFANKLNKNGTHRFESCEEIFQHEEILACTADLLADIADAVAPVTWDAGDVTDSVFVGLKSQTSAWMKATWVIGVQGSKDKFIARDLAINVLANLARLDLERPNRPGGPVLPSALTCADSFVRSAYSAPFFSSNAAALYGQSPNANPPKSPAYFEPKLSITTANSPALAESRLRFNAHILRASGRLMRKLIDDSAFADMAGAERQRGLSGDPKRGPELYWGARTDSISPYNSLAHAMRVVFGRWETGRPATWGPAPVPAADAPLPTGDPRCGGFSPIELLIDAMGEGTSARWQDRRVRSAAHEQAVAVVDNGGIVIPAANLAAQTDFTVVRSAVKSQLVLSAARVAGYTSELDPGFGQRKQVVETLVDGIDDADLRFALERGAGSYRLLTGAGESLANVLPPDPTKPEEGPAGAKLVPVAGLAPGLATLGGHVLAGGAPRDDVAVDIMARVGPAQAASQCKDFQPAGVAEGAANMGKVAAFQDAFMIADTLRRRLSAIRQATASPEYPKSASEFPRLADMASAELRTWTGPAYAVARTAAVRDGAIDVRLFGLTPRDLGVATTQQMKGRIVAVWGKPWVADCAARLRTSCPPGFDADYVQAPSSEAVDAEVANYAAYTGADERVLTLDFAFTGPPKFTPAVAPSGAALTDFLYLVLKSDPAAPGKGKVLATFALHQPGDQWTYALISDYQRKLANELFGVSSGWAAKSRKLGEQSTTSPPGYCIEGVPRDFFIPLENELTSDSDAFETSWKHYLSLAKEAASKADELGQKLIDIGLQQDYRREAAGEEVGKICGDFGALDDLKVEKGEVKNTSNDANLNLCLDEPSHDVVFLSDAPPDSVDIKKKLLLCDDPAGKSNALCAKAKLDVGSLKFDDYYDPDIEQKADPLACDGAIGLVNSVAGGFVGEQVQALASKSELSQGEIGSIVNALRLVVKPDLHWNVRFDDAAIMSTEGTVLWPACAGSCGAGLPAQLATVFGSGTMSDPASRDLLLQKVTGAIWLMAAMSEQLPEGVFSLPVPARANLGDEESAPAPLLYASAKFTPSGLGYVLDVSDDGFGKIPNESKAELGDAKVIEGAFLTGTQSSGRPQWVKDAYAAAAQASPGKYLHVGASNSARTFPKQPTLIALLDTVAKNLSGVSDAGACAADKPEKVAAAIKAMRELKYPKDLGRMCRSPNGKASLLFFGRDNSYMKDVLVWENSEYPDSASDFIPWSQAKGAKGSVHQNDAFFDGWLLSTGTDISAACRHPINAVAGFDVVSIKGKCLRTQSFQTFPDRTRFTRHALLPDACKPDDRAQLFVNSNNPYPTGCDAARELSRALALSCVLGSAYRAMPVGDALPALNEPEDIVKLENWVSDQARNARVSLSRLVVTNVPKRVIKDFEFGKVGTGALKGEHGQLVLQYRQDLSTLATGWLSLEKDFKAIEGAIRNARIGLIAAKLSNQQELKTLAMQSLQIEAQMLKSAVHAAGSIAGALSGPDKVNPFQAAAAGVEAGIDAWYGAKQQGILDDLKNIADEKKANAVLGTLNTLQDTVSERHTAIQQTLESMKLAAAGALKTASALEQKENEAKYHAAKGSGVDYVMIDGKVVQFPVNTVLRRQYDITKRRYEATLRQAKYLAYVARLAIEQRIGQRLDEIDEPVGALEAPSTWANDLCSFQGVNYEALRQGLTPDAGKFAVALDVIFTQYADPFIGDYVQKLENFVEFYNIAYPSHEGDDVAVLSMRDDLLGPQGRCFKPARNLLFFSQDLRGVEVVTEGAKEVTHGWQLNPCEPGDTKCLSASSGSILQQNGAPLAPPGVAASEGITWLHDVDGSSLFSIPGSATAQPAAGPPPGSVYQAVDLGSGSFALSWFDSARGPTAADVPTTSSAPYRVAVYGPTWQLLASFAEPAHVSDGTPGVGHTWSPRRIVSFSTQQPGTHYVVFAASQVGAAKGSVAIADAQLEEAAAGTTVTAYEGTDASRLILTGACVAGSAAGFRSAFQYKCDSLSCFYELIQPLSIDTTALNVGESALDGKIAKDNFNYRHVDVALNVVGTGVVDCAKNPTPSCYGSAYVEYTLEHDAFASSIIDYVGQSREFNFGSAGIHHGKALAAERFITLPVGSADQALLSQPSVQKVELRGRPLSGAYRVRVFDGPSLVWNQVEDVQVVLTYRYWSRVQRESQKK